MNYKAIAYKIVKNAPIHIFLINTKYINNQISRYTRKRDEFEQIKSYIYQLARMKGYEK
ncbi:hypothetical protein [Staphylococcus hominis]|uniref:hypothetical protein n=1 Tax=Staphylococcus hominis TaxID=1290 RepID=UPI002DD66484|nr:hypothetical protein [Staphylococcus hominis]WRY66458.1 hypothetical protein P8632_03805 [Staphylococcus hominis]